MSAQPSPVAVGDARPILDELSRNVRLLIDLRWAAGSGILLCTGFARFVIDVDLQAVPLVIIGLGVLAYNVVLYLLSRRNLWTGSKIWRMVWTQILLDWVAVIALVHFTGGITSPALIYFVIHVAFSGMLLFPWQSRILGALAVIIVGGLACAERGAIPYVAVPELGLPDDLHKNWTYILSILFFFGSTVITLSELVAAKVQRLRQREEHISQLYDARTTFVRVATHELRAPLAAGLSLINNIEQGYVGTLTEQQAALVHRVADRLEGLRQLVDDLLALASSREAIIAQEPLHPVSIRSSLEMVVERERPNAEQKSVTLDVQLTGEPGIVMASETGLVMILGNLLNNAIKYTTSGGRVSISCCQQKSPSTVEVTISDTGIGIPAEDLPRIFNEFFRAKNAKKAQIIGSGIGLTTVRTLLDTYHGSIDIQSVEGQGTTVRVSLPAAQMPAK